MCQLNFWGKTSTSDIFNIPVHNCESNYFVMVTCSGNALWCNVRLENCNLSCLCLVEG